MTKRFDGKVAVVTGSGQSIGKEIALLLAKEGAKVVTNNRNADTPEGTAEQTAQTIKASGGQAVAVYGDVGTIEGGNRIINTCLDTFGTIDILINNAGGGTGTMPLEHFSEEEWDYGIDSNLKGQFTCTRLALPVMKAKGWGRVINISSRVGLHGLTGMTVYAAAKAGIMGLTFALALELRGTGITANCVSPTANTVRSERTRDARAAATGGHRLDPSPLQTPEHIAPICVYLATEETAGITGQIFYATGGEVTLYKGPWPEKSIRKDSKWSLDELSTAFPKAFGTELDLIPAGEMKAWSPSDE
ncbi:SDR family oxidoreductase [Dehalococcoidia bacterium]|nr:SDR family oxidoreductase [Dehalococcoidia bacterium]